MKYKGLTEQIIGICIKAHEKLGPGLLESVYEEAICYELDKARLSYKCQQGIAVNYEDVKLEIGFRADVIVERQVMLNLNL